VRLALCLLLSVPALAAPEMIPVEEPAAIGRTAPPMQLKTLDGADFDLERYRGKPVVLAFWASWCTPCRRELPALDELAKRRNDVHVFAVNVDRARAKAERFLEDVPITLPVVWDNDSRVMGQLDVTAMPTTFVVDAQGTVKWRKSGFAEDKGLEELEQVLAGLVR
jgi:thiol-disulfide isomerase/thioredoxin